MAGPPGGELPHLAAWHAPAAWRHPRVPAILGDRAEPVPDTSRPAEPWADAALGTKPDALTHRLALEVEWPERLARVQPICQAPEWTWATAQTGCAPTSASGG